MAGYSSPWLLRVCVLLMLARPLSPSSRPEEDTATLRQLPEDMEQQDVGPEKIPLQVVVAVSLAGVVLQLLLLTICCPQMVPWQKAPKMLRRGEVPEPPGLSTAMLLQGTPGGTEAQPCPDAAIPVPRLSAEAQAEEQKSLWKRRRLHFSPQL